MKRQILGILFFILYGLIFLLSVLVFSTKASAVDYYWVGGTGTWSDLTHWSNSSGGTGSAYATPPQSSDDVFFDTGSGLNSGSTITITSATTSTCENMTFNTGVSGINISGSSTARLDVNGSTTLEPNMNFTWEGFWYFYQSTDGSLNTFTTAHNTLVNRLIRFEQPSSGTGGNFDVVNKFTQTTTAYNYAKTVVNLQNSTDIITFNDTAYFSNSYVDQIGLDVLVGEVRTSMGFQTGNIHVGTNGKLLNYGDCTGQNIAIEGEVDFNAGSTATGNKLNFKGVTNSKVTKVTFSGSGHYWWSGSHGQTGAIVKYSNCEMRVRYYFTFGSSRLYQNNASNCTIDASGSTMVFSPSAAIFAISSHTFNNVHIEGGTTSNFQIIGAGSTGTLAPTLDTLIAERSTSYLNYTNTGSNVNTHNTHMQITGYLKFTGGNNYSGRINGSRYYLVSGADLDMQGSCVEPVGLSGVTHDMTGVGSITTNNLLFKGTCIAQPGSYPAGPGSRAITGVTVTGWTFGANTPRTLVWIGAIPSDVSDHNTYANWSVDTNWCDVTANPTWTTDPNIAPGNPAHCGSVCPPTEIDSVIFPDQSYVRPLESTIYCSGMNWLQRGRIYGNTSQNLEIWASLHLSAEMTNSFTGTTRFRNDKTYRCAITSNGNPVQAAMFNSRGGNGEWVLTDDFRTIRDDAECKSGSGASSMRIHSGHLYSGTMACTPGNGVRIDAIGFAMTGGELSLFDSDFYVVASSGSYLNNYYKNLTVVDAAVINAGTSHFFLRLTRATPHSSFGFRAAFGNDTLYDITLLNDNSNAPGYINHHVIFNSGSSVHHLNTGPTVRPVILTRGSNANPVFIQKIDFNSSLSTNRSILFRTPKSPQYHTALVNKAYAIEVDTLLSNGQLNIGVNLYVNNTIQMVPGYTHVIGTSSNPASNGFCSVTLNGARSVTHNYLNLCPGGSTVNYTGAEADISGDCFSGGNTLISNGTFVINTPKPFNPSYLALTNNQISGPDMPYLAPNSSFSGVTTGWDTGGGAIPRTLRWKDVSGTASNTGNWQDANYWEQILPTYAAAPQCPPNKVDTVVFDNTSFSANSQEVEMTGVTSIASMYWNSIPAGQSPILKGGSGQTLTISADFKLHVNMTYNHLGTNAFYADATLGANDFYITTAGKTLAYRALFRGGDDTKWHLQDDLTIAGSFSASNNQIVLYRGQLYTEGNDVSTPRFQAVGNDYRKLDMTNSTITLRYSGHINNPEWNITGTMIDGSIPTFELVSDGSTLFSTNSSVSNHYSSSDTYVLGGKHYNTIITSGCNHTLIGINGFSRDTINEFISHRDFSRGGTTSNILRSDSIYIKKGILNAPFTIQTEGGQYDSLLIKKDANISSNNKYHKYLSFESGKNYLLTSGKVQWIQNLADVSLNGGSASSIIQFYGTSTSNPSYIRKDSLFLCANYVNVRDIWAIGNGNNLANSCYSGTVNNFCSNANDWIVSSCDTITDKGAECGPWIRNETSRGRADFNGGEFADFQGGNTFGWDDSPYPPTPELDLPTLDKDVCSNEVISTTFEIIGVLPAYLTYDSAGVMIDTLLTTPGYGIGSQDLTGSGTVADPYIWIYTTTMPPFEDSLVIEAVDVTFDRCFIGAATIAGDVKFTRICWDPLPVELLHFYAVKEENTSLLSWETASETNNAYFDIQRSSDGENFHSIGKVEGAGNSTQNIAYSFVDENPLSGKNYYRLQQVDFDGGSEFSPVEIVDFGELNTVTIYPNPVRDVLNIETNLKEAKVIIRDVSGKTVLIEGQVSERNTIDVSQLAAGSYLVEIVDETTTQRIFKKLEILD